MKPAMVNGRQWSMVNSATLEALGEKVVKRETANVKGLLKYEARALAGNRQWAVRSWQFAVGNGLLAVGSRPS